MLSKIAKEIAENNEVEKLSLATIIKASGSSPRKNGASMIIYPDGIISGTIGGGPVEKEVMDRAIAKLNGEISNEDEKMHFDISNEDAAKAGGICGGEVDIFLEIISRKGEK